MKQLVTYINFDGTCREAMTFYAKCMGAEVHFMTYGEAKCGAPAEADDKIIHARILHGPVARLMASDAVAGFGPPLHQGNNFSVAAGCESVEEVQTFFDALKEGGSATMEPHDAFWGARFAMLTDRFGVNWMLDFEYPK